MAEKGESDYVIKFPTSKNVKWLNAEPLVFIFGWAGCKNRYLDKYAQFYTMQGCTTYQFTCPSNILFWCPERISELVETMADEFFESGYGGHPILFHVFSNGGCAVLTRFLQYFQSRTQQPTSSASSSGDVDLRGIVFDSSPARGDNWTRARAFTEAMYGHWRPWIKRIVVGALSVVFSIWNCYRSLINWFRGVPSPARYHPYWTLSKLDLRCPMLFLYSKADAICKYQSIEAFTAKQGRRGVQVTQIRFEDSPHCQHRRVYPNEYNEAVKKFLYEAMGAAPKKQAEPDNGAEDFVKVGDNGGNGKPEDTDDFELAG